MALIELERVVTQQHNANQPTNTFQQDDFSFMNHLVEEHCNVNHDSYAYNTRSKRRVVEEVTPPPTQASTSSVVPHVQNVS